jgi:hypothetical protein
MTTDNLGITELEDKQIAAISAGADSDTVRSLSPVGSDVPEMIDTQEVDSSFYDDEGLLSDESLYEPESIKMSDAGAAKNSLYGVMATGDSEGLDDKYYRMYDYFRAYGRSPEYDAIADDVRKFEEQSMRVALFDIASQGDVEATQRAVEAAPEVLDERSDVRVAALENTAVDFSEDIGTEEATSARVGYIDKLNQRTEFDKTFNRILDRAVAEASLDLEDYALDTIDQAVLGEQIFGLSNVGTDILGESYTLLGGTMLRDLATHLNNTPIEHRTAEAEKIVDSIVRHSGVATNNDVVKVFALETLRDFYEAPGNDIPFDRWMGDVIGVTEVAAFLPISFTLKGARNLSKALKAPSRILKTSSLQGDLQKANPVVSANITGQSIENAQVARDLGTTPANELGRIVPSMLDDTEHLIEGAPEAVRDVFKVTKTRSQEVDDFIVNTFNYSDADYIKKQKNIERAVQGDNYLAQISPANIAITRHENQNSLIVRAVYGQGDEIPMSLSEARKTSSRITQAFRENEINVSNPPVILTKEPGVGTWRPYNKATDVDADEFRVAVDMVSPMRQADIAGEEVLGSGNTKAVGRLGRYLLMDPQSWVNRTLLSAARIASDAKMNQTHDLHKLAAPFFTLNNRSKRKVINLLQEGEEQQKVFNYRELESKAYSDNEINAYFSKRFLDDTVYRIKNLDSRKKLQDEGWQGLTIVEADGRAISNAFTEVSEEVVRLNAKSIYDPYQKRSIGVTDDTFSDLRSRGLMVGKVKHKIDVGNEEYTYVVAKNSDTHELPQNVLQYRVGYNYRVNNDPYFIDEVSTKSVNGNAGQKSSRTVKVARNNVEARQAVDSLAAKNPSNKYSIRIDRSINSSDSALKSDIESLDGSGMNMWYSKRGERLTRWDGSESQLEDPVKAMNNMISSISNVQAHGELLENAVVRHRRTYGHLEVKGSPLWEWDNAKNDWHFDKVTAKEAGRPEIKAALAEYEYIENLKYVPTKIDKEWRDLLEDIDATIGRAGNESASKISKGFLLDVMSKSTPGQVTRAGTFALTIAVHPLRHILLQSTTGLHLMGIDPKATIKAGMETSVMAMSMATWQKPGLFKVAKKMANGLGYSDEEWTELFTAFRKSGKAYAIDSNVAIGEAEFKWARNMPKSAAGDALQLAENVAKSPFTLGKAIGFDTGELMNQMFSWLFAVKQWKKANPGKNFSKSKMAQDQINASARNFSVDMTKTSAFGYQQGAFASMTQFMAINQKMALKALGIDQTLKAGSKEHFAFVGGLLAMYGAAGLGLQEVYDSWSKESGLDIDPTLDSLMYGGFAQALVDSALDLTFDNTRGTNKTAFSSSFAPTSGIINFAPDFVKNIWEGNLLEAMAGPSGNTLPHLADAAGYMADLWYLRDSYDSPDIAIKAFQRATEQFGAFSGLYKLNLMMAYKDQFDKMYIVGSNGRPTVEARGMGEIWMKGLLNVSTRGEQEFYNDYLAEFRDLNSSGKKFTAQVDKDAKHIAKYWYETLATTSDPIEAMEKIRSITFALHGGNRNYGHAVMKKAQSLVSLNPQFDSFVTDLFKTKSVFDADANFVKMRNAVNNSHALDPAQKERVVKNIEALETSVSEGRRIFNENF